MFKSLWTHGTVARQAPLPMGFPRQEHWNTLPFSSPGDLSDPGIEPMSPALEADFFFYHWATWEAIYIIDCYIKTSLEANPKLTIENVNPIFNQYIALGAIESPHSSDLKLLGRQANIKQINKFQKKTRSWFFEKINNINKPLARLIRKKGRGLKSINLEMKKKLQLTP